MKRIFKFHLRTFLIVVTLICIGMGIHIRRTQHQKSAVAAIREFGGWIRYDFQLSSGTFDANAESPFQQWAIDSFGIDFFHNVREVNLVYTNDYGGRSDNRTDRPAPLEVLKHMPYLTALYTAGGQSTDENMRHIVHLKHLETYFAWDATSLTDEGASYLASLKKLKKIHISKSGITDKTLAVIAGLPRIKDLTLQFNNFTREGPVLLAGKPELESLWICGREGLGNNIDDDSLEFLLEVKNLKELGIQDTEISEGFAATLQKKFPNCVIAHR